MLKIPILDVEHLSEDMIFVYEDVIQDDLYYKGQLILSYTVKFPRFISACYQVALDKINNYYKTKANMYVQTDIGNLYQNAAVDYEYAVSNNFPVRSFEVITEFVVTYNRDCVLSLYFDRYEYTGGAHGSTVRTSDTWNVACSSPVRLDSLFPFAYDLDEYVTDNIARQINQLAMTEAESFPYFDDYEVLVREHFNPYSFYLTYKDVIIYYQQYDIAPYSTGIPEFLIPYGIGAAIRPRYC